MRSEKEMFDLILRTAEEDERIRAVYMNGSRTNPNVKRDIFQDYDIMYVVTETASFIADERWIDRFGARLYMQLPEKHEPHTEECWGWLIQFADGNRLDLHVVTEKCAKREIVKDRLCRILLEKDGILPAMPPPTDEDYWVKRPTEDEFHAVCNEYWWCLNNVAKGIWREEIPYVQDMANVVLRPQLIKALSWKVGIKTGFSVSVGKSGKEMWRWLAKEEWTAFLSTYAAGNISAIKTAYTRMCQLFDATACDIAGSLGFVYDRTEADNSFSYFLHVINLPKNAKTVY